MLWKRDAEKVPYISKAEREKRKQDEQLKLLQQDTPSSGGRSPNPISIAKPPSSGGRFLQHEKEAIKE
ncbi:hypothetical protein DI09_9p100 [Mitosporidium daphniae]|uniref:Uncharacterized protein n=1 Tax=Mitosporidium daphniae TaxID=1485682 RepID=A0A098VLG0_9MICR|nr:uncharacterized protein DI09_9p100 [Mitosporidium daphniae]KGG49927.1 hypothetical protein DI09_9p100 [Mitosporidium daphniae]|eukprot:XP_013236354.1 uncharacterized protein DI09_9p100 [Mitosporidium daphniae]